MGEVCWNDILHLLTKLSSTAASFQAGEVLENHESALRHHRTHHRSAGKPNCRAWHYCIHFRRRWNATVRRKIRRFQKRHALSSPARLRRAMALPGGLRSSTRRRVLLKCSSLMHPYACRFYDNTINPLDLKSVLLFISILWMEKRKISIRHNHFWNYLLHELFSFLQKP